MLASTSKKHDRRVAVRKFYAVLPLLLLLSTIAAWLLVDAVLPLHGLSLPSAQLGVLHSFLLLPSHILFAGNELTPFLAPKVEHVVPPPFTESWRDTAFLLGAFALLFFCYLLALKYLYQRVGLRYILVSTCLLGCICALIPVVTSPDLFSYIMYARMWVLYSLNPLTTPPFVVSKDAVYQYLYWKDQPSAYGPTWLFLSGFLQWITMHVFPTEQSIAAMVLALRLLNLVAHLWSVMLVWSISGSLQRLIGADKFHLRVLATLAFAWNPLVLFEACVNAHNDTVMLLLILLGIWLLVRYASVRAYICVALLFALATCLKANVALLLPGLLIYLWICMSDKRVTALVLFIYLGTVFTLYAPFWQNAALLKLLSVNPGTYRNINTIPDFIGQACNVIWHILGHPLPPEIGSPAERVTHSLSTLLFALAYIRLCWQALFTYKRLDTLVRFIRWLAKAWFLYCLLGAPWFWPWYAVTFFGLFALVEASVQTSAWEMINSVLTFRVFAFTLLSAYCFVISGVHESFIPFLPGFRWAYLRGVWIWLPVLVLLLLATRKGNIQSRV